MILTAALVHLALQTSMLVARPDFAWSRFRGFFPFDQTSYLAIVVNGARGDVTWLEPFTLTSVTHYPQAYYVFLGLVARITGLLPETTWHVIGLAMQVLLVAVIAMTTMSMAGRRWTGLLAPLPFVIGTFAMMTGPDWYSRLNAHAVLWGAFAVLFPLNAESASLCICGTCLLALLLVADGRFAPRARAPIAIAACFAIGLMSSVQTYSFLTAVYLVSYVAAAHSLIVSGSRTATVLSLVLLASLLVVGPSVATTFGPLAVLAAGLVPTAPGLGLMAARRSRPVLACMTVALIGALPQVAWTIEGVATGDPFLLYRQAATTSTLAVPWKGGAIAAAIPLAALAFLLIAGLRRRRPLWLACVAGAVPAWSLLAGNDRWGVFQEPYRLWIDCFTLVSIAMLPLVVSALIALRRERGFDAIGAFAACIVLVVAIAVASRDFAGFWRNGRWDIAMIDYRDAKGDAVAKLAGSASRVALPSGLRLADPCIDPFMLKVRAEGPTAFFNYGMAWPSHQPELRRVLVARQDGELRLDDARTANVTMLLTDSSCRADWPTRYRDALDEVARAPYASDDGTMGEVVLWRLRSVR